MIKLYRRVNSKLLTTRRGSVDRRSSNTGVRSATAVKRGSISAIGGGPRTRILPRYSHQRLPMVMRSEEWLGPRQAIGNFHDQGWFRPSEGADRVYPLLCFSKRFLDSDLQIGELGEVFAPSESFLS
jgi:hypothetical protein